MYKLGLDFGTTNSILTYQDAQTLESFKLGGANATNYIPSCVSINKKDQSIQIGRTAIANRGDDDYHFFRNFKMLLAEHDSSQLNKWGYVDYSPQEITKFYIQNLLKSYRTECGLDQDLKKIVITVPEIWVREGRHAARESLKQICTDLQLPVKMLSEPVAAAVYFAHQFKNKEGRSFNGHVLVCDYGGGTLDLSLSSLQNDEVKVLEGTGKGNVANTLGKAGVAYDEAVVKNILTIDNKDLEGHHYKFIKEFEEHKIDRTEDLDKPLTNYLRDQDANKTVFKIDGTMPVKAQHLAEVFEQLIKPTLSNALEEMSTYLTHHNVDTKNSDKFRVIMVGGFSNFCLVQRLVKDFFDSKTGQDSRFINHFSKIDTSLAISKGATLVANGVYEVNMACPISVSLQAKNSYGQDKYFTALKKGTPLLNYKKPKFIQAYFHLYSENAFEDAVKLSLDAGNGKVFSINLGHKLAKLLPNPHIHNKWKIGFSVDDDLMFHLHAVDEVNNENITSLGDLQEKMRGLHICGE